MKVCFYIGFLALVLGLGACQTEVPALPTALVLSTFTPSAEAPVPPLEESATATPPQNLLPPTWTPEPTLVPIRPTRLTASNPINTPLTARVMAEALNVRQGPANDFASIAILNSAQVVEIVGISENGQWYLIKYSPNAEGWIFANMVEVSGDLGTAPNRQPTPIAGEQAQLIRVIDGDTIDVRVNGVEQRVRYIGMNTPERDEPCYQDARNYNSDLIQGQELTLVKDQSETDQFGRLLRYVYIGNFLVNRELVKQGYAEAVLYEPDGRFFLEFSQLEQAAAQQNLACHATGIFQDDSNTR